MLISSILFAFTFEETTSQSHSYIDRPLLVARNQYLRLYVLHKKNRVKSCFCAATDVVKYKTTQMYHSVVSKYYEAPAFYYSLPPEEREIIEQLINLHF